MAKSYNRSITIDWIIAHYHNLNDTGEPLPYNNPESELTKLPDDIFEKMLAPLVERAEKLKFTDIPRRRLG